MGSTVAYMDSTEFAAAVAANVDLAIKRAGKTVLSIASETGIPRTTLERRLRSAGLSPFTVTEIKAIGIALSIPARDLVTVTVAAEVA